MKSNFICLIPARSGSKTIKRKNLKIIGNKPLIYWTIKEALKSKYISNVIVSTDSKLIQNKALEFGAEAPFLRPKKLSNDNSRTIDVIRHLVEYLKKKNKNDFKYIILLQPTSPLRTQIDIDNSIKLFLKNKKATSLISVTEVNDNHPARMYYLNKIFLKKNPLSEKKDGVARQKLKPMYLRNGAIYIIKKKNISNNFIGKNPIAYKMPREKSINIDDHFDFMIANFLLCKK